MTAGAIPILRPWCNSIGLDQKIYTPIFKTWYRPFILLPTGVFVGLNLAPGCIVSFRRFRTRRRRGYERGAHRGGELAALPVIAEGNYLRFRECAATCVSKLASNGPTVCNSAWWTSASFSRVFLPRGESLTKTWRLSSLDGMRLTSFLLSSRLTRPTALWCAIRSRSASSPMVAKSRDGKPSMARSARYCCDARPWLSAAFSLK